MLQFFSLDIILKFSKIVILEFSDSPTQILVFFLSRKTVGQATQTKYFLDGRLILSSATLSVKCIGPKT